MAKVVGILLKGEPYRRDRPLDSLNFLWLTLNQFNKIMSEQNEFRGKCYWVDNRVFRLSDVMVAQEFDLEELRKSGRITPYLLEAIEAENEPVELLSATELGLVEG